MLLECPYWQELFHCPHNLMINVSCWRYLNVYQRPRCKAPRFIFLSQRFLKSRNSLLESFSRITLKILKEGL